MLKTAIPQSHSWILLLSVFAPLTAFAGFVQNPSFESPYNEIGPHYGSADGWSGASGINNTTGPFHNGNTAIPDQTYVGFKQGSGTVTQVISGLVPNKQYWLQYNYDARTNSLLDLAVKWSETVDETLNETVIDSVSAVIAGTTGAYRFRSVAFTPTTDTGTLTFQSTATGDSTLLLDAVSITQRDAGQVVVQNPSFEASGDLLENDGVTTSGIAGWAPAGTVGINTAAGPFANNGTIPDQDHALFIQRAGSITQTIRGLIAGKPYTLALNVNARTGNTPHVLATANGATVIDTNVAAVGGVAAYTNVSGGFTADSDTVELVISQTVDATDQTLLVDNVRLTGEYLPPLPPLRIGPASLELAPNTTGTISVTVSQERLARGECVVVLQSENPGVAEFTDVGVEGNLTLTFPANQPATTLTSEIEGFTRGFSSIKVLDNGGNDEIQGSVNVNVVTSFVLNASFEGNGAPAYPGTGEISAWTKSGGGNAGLNTSAGPFHNNGLNTRIPDRTQVAFLQGAGRLSQTIHGLTAGQRYWLQFSYDARNCCDGALPNVRAFIDNNIVFEALAVTPVSGTPYYLAQAEFTATAEMADLAIESEVPSGDATVLLDAVSIVQRNAGEIVVQNPSFEASGIANGVGYIQNDQIAGWQMAGGYGVNVDERGPFSDNGIAGAQDRVLFIQNTGSATQTISGLTTGKTYNLSFLMNARNQVGAGHTPYQIVVDDTVLEEGVQEPVGAGAPYTEKSLSFIALSDTAVIAFKCVPENNSDQTLLVDDVHVTAAGSAASVTLTIAPLAGNSVVLRWPSSSPANLVLKTSTTMTVGSWSTVSDPVTVENGQNTVIRPFNGVRRFYQLFQP